MSQDDLRPGAVPPPRTALDLGQQRKRAKDLRRAFERGDPEAEARIRRHLVEPRAEIRLAQAQYVIAREAGFESWPGLKLYLVHRDQSRAELRDSILAAAIAGHRASVESARTRAPDLVTRSLHVASALADEEAVSAQLAAGPPEAIRERAGTLDATPLAYVCRARLGRDDPAVGAARARVARKLLAAGADPNECIETLETPGGLLSILSAAARYPASAELVGELLEAGAALEPPGSTAGPPAPPLVGAAIGGNLACLERLLAARAPEWQAREALEVAIEGDHRAMVRALLDYGCLPDRAGRWQGRNGGCLHAAIALGRDPALLRLLLEGGASVGTRDRDGRTPLEIAVQMNDPEAADLLRDFGASDAEVSDLDRWIGACFAGDRERRTSLLSSAPPVLGLGDHQNVCRAVRRGDPRALRELLNAGLDPDVPDDDGQTALHLAVARRDLASVALLREHGAASDRPSYENVTPLEAALSEPDDALREALTRALCGAEPGASTLLTRSGEESAERIDAHRRTLAVRFEQAVDRMVDGDLEGLRRLLDAEPALATARSPRYHRATLLHYLGSNGTERPVAPANAADLAELLIERGAAIDASCRMYGGGPQQTTLGLAATTDPSAYPPGALAALIRTLVGAGARIHDADGRSPAIEGAIAYGATIAMQALAESGARAYDLETAAALGDLTALEHHLPSSAADARVEALGIAAVFEHRAILVHLLDAGTDVNARGTCGGTALHRAAGAGAIESVGALLARGADLEARDPVHDATPADWARHFGRADVLAVLEKMRPSRS